VECIKAWPIIYPYEKEFATAFSVLEQEGIKFPGNLNFKFKIYFRKILIF